MAAIRIYILGGGGMDKAHAVDANQIIAAALASPKLKLTERGSVLNN